MHEGITVLFEGPRVGSSHEVRWLKKNKVGVLGGFFSCAVGGAADVKRQTCKQTGNYKMTKTRQRAIFCTMQLKRHTGVLAATRHRLAAAAFRARVLPCRAVRDQ